MDESFYLEVRVANLERQRDLLVDEIILYSKTTSAHMVDCRTCDYRVWCKCGLSQIEPNYEMCKEAILKYTESDEVLD